MKTISDIRPLVGMHPHAGPSHVKYGTEPRFVHLSGIDNTKPHDNLRTPEDVLGYMYNRLMGSTYAPAVPLKFEKPGTIGCSVPKVDRDYTPTADTACILGGYTPDEHAASYARAKQDAGLYSYTPLADIVSK